ncbi:MAG: 6-phosphogluconolactonase [Anaerolineae bacterium]|nr:6-phosphogluconolactonase [Anaerolineae bacterium]
MAHNHQAWHGSLEFERVVLADANAVAHEAARRFVSQVRTAVDARGRFGVALSGGSTPSVLYRLLAQPPYCDQVAWRAVHIFWGDERCVPPEDPASNYYLARVTLLNHVSIPAENVHRLEGERDPVAAARAYDRALQEFYCGPQPRFDLVLLGLGRDGHTASLFPGSPALDEREQLVMPAEAEYDGRPACRLTLTLPAINSARCVLFLVTGEDKASMVVDVLHHRREALPAQRVAPTAGEVIWLLDRAAAAGLSAIA